MKPALLVLAMVLLAGAAAAQLEPNGLGFNITFHTMPLWMVFHYTPGQTITDYNFTPWSDFNGRNNSWTILGSNDGHTLYPLDTRINITGLTQNVNSSFTLAVNGSFTYYYVYLWYGFGTSDEKMAVHLYANGVEVPVSAYFINASNPQPVDPITIVAGLAGVITFIGYRRKGKV